jgi:hypothetical protein
MRKTINKKNTQDVIPPLKPGQWNSYSPADIKRWGVERFLDEVCAKEPIAIPNLGFTEEENRRMDQILEEERQASANGL